MKDEELFKAWKSEQYKDQSTEEKMEFVEHLHTFPKYFEKTFLAGLKAGRPQWHDLRKDPEDLPIGEVFYWFDENPNLKDGKVYGRSIGYYNPYEKEWHGYYKGCPCRVHNVIAWCEIPTFDKE